ncbi:SPARC isoform X1 [Hydra vulgaris]|uniref:SPARC isoform X1 n=1 Tax=Hydra vulgaris TaxID=6087 RepID=UPI001F5F8747|nr:SPARC-like [Hydra vulgaris]
MELFIWMCIVYSIILQSFVVSSEGDEEHDDLSEILENDYQHVNYINNGFQFLPNINEMEEKFDEIMTLSEIHQIDNLAQLYILKPCLAKRCYNGTMCVVIDNDLKKDALNRTKCVCPTKCENVEKPVCCSKGVTYKNKCEAHKKACKLNEHIEIAYEGNCIAKNTCSFDDLNSFIPRFLEWMRSVREEYLYGDLIIKTNSLDFGSNEGEHVVEWMFKYFDESKDDIIGPIEISNLLNSLMSMEPCIKDFINECDSDGNGHIFFSEWKKCLLPGSNSVEDTFFDNI